MSPRARRTYKEIFIDALRKVTKGESKRIGNISLRNTLGWTEERYNSIKSQLIAEGVIIGGHGQGGSVRFPEGAFANKLKIFISYSHVDEDIKDRLLLHLEPLRRVGLIADWHDRKLMPGDEWEKEISNNLNKADIVLLLISIDFINSKYCYDLELERALELHDQQQVRVIPVILRNCMWNYTPFAKLQALPTDAKAVMAWSDMDGAFTNIAEGVKKVAEEMRAERQSV